MVWTRMISPAQPAATIFSRHSQSGPTNSFCAEPVCRTQNSRVIRRFPANEVAGTFDASAISPPNGKPLTSILGCQALARSSKLFSLAEAQYHRRQKGFFSRVKNTEA